MIVVIGIWKDIILNINNLSSWQPFRKNIEITGAKSIIGNILLVH